MRKIAKTGNSGEKLAAEYLRKHGFIISQRNFHSRFGEIDIIAENEQYILFVEVKTRKVGAKVSPAESVDIHKQRKIVSTAKVYMMKSYCTLQPRFDVAEIEVSELAGREEYKINYIENAFVPEGF